MTAVGKILVFINLLCSLAVGGLVTMVYVARTHWVSEFTKLQNLNQIAVASEQAYKKEAEKAAADRDLKIAEKDAQLKKALADLKTVQDSNDQLTRDMSELRKKQTSSTAVTEASQQEVIRRQADVEQVRANLKSAREENVKLVLDKQNLLDRAVAAEIQMKTVKDTNERIEKQLQELTKELVRMRSGVGTGAVARTGSRNPPPENIEGLVRQASADGLVTITIGSDAGLSKGHTLEVFRLSSVPHQSKYLGTIRILEVTPTQAVGQPTGRMAAPMQPGDKVASSILGG